MHTRAIRIDTCGSSPVSSIARPHCGPEYMAETCPGEPALMPGYQFVQPVVRSVPEATRWRVRKVPPESPDAGRTPERREYAERCRSNACIHFCHLLTTLMTCALVCRQALPFGGSACLCRLVQAMASDRRLLMTGTVTRVSGISADHYHSS